MKKQVEKDHYAFTRYASEARFVSYYHQARLVVESGCATVLEVGVGDQVLGSYLKNNTGISYKSMDIDPELKPDIVGSVTDIQLPDNSIDCVCAFEVLEHIPFDQFERALKEIKRVSKKTVLISLPHFGPPLQLSFKIPFLKPVQLSIKIPYFKKHIFNRQHYWEIGKRGYAPRKIKNIFKKYYKLKEDFIPFQSQYHHFFVLEK